MQVLSIKSAPSLRQGYMQLSTQLNPQYMRAMAAYRRLERSVPREELRALTTIGLLNGARQAEQQMEQHLVNVIKELLEQTAGSSNSVQVLPKIDEIEQQLVRDQRALQILESAMDLVSSAKDERTFREEMREALQQQRVEELQAQQLSADITQAPHLGERLAKLRRHIMEKVPTMKTQLESKIEKTLEHLIEEAATDGLLAKASHKVLRKRDAKTELKDLENGEEDFAKTEEARPAEVRMIKSILSEANDLRVQHDFRENLVLEQYERRPERQVNSKKATKSALEEDDNDNENENELDEFALDFNVSMAQWAGNVTVTSNATKQGKQEDESAELTPTDIDNDGGGGGGGGGLVGIIGSLSGGEGGSDVGALIGALTGVISTLFGPGGLDIESLISTATSLLAGLLSGNQNFGTVLGQYVSTALDGLSGGGGAINNGQFLGNFLGTIVASLSADPEEEGPIQPLVFAQNLLSSFLEAKNRPPSAENSAERHGSAELPARQKKKEATGLGGGGSDSGSFVKQIVSHLVSSALGLLLNASLGASGGASHASSGLFSSSSAASHHMKPAHRSWTFE
ncbi:uncharacterized protein LOC115627971 [Scaptodrosophila lebanonensis]|uniref:Uncharacterized protein LOC115627971 n=1 Tax=Drosophila lebanonensis TaxID=7225 RepID=A0A6J2TT18_DROLE|nr:uncharacterized protein LOC115627971 [Scaptodrosophila lebanonensis]